MLNLFEYIENFRVNEWLEHGSFIAVELKIEEVLMQKAKKNVKLFETLEDFVADVSSSQEKLSPNVKLNNIRNLFLYFVVFLMAVLFVSFIDTFLFHQMQAILRKLIRWSVMLALKMQLRANLKSIKSANS